LITMRPAISSLVLLSLVVLFHDSFAVPSPRKVVTEDGKVYNEDDCEAAAKDAENSGACGVIFEKTECDDGLFGNGDSKEIKEGVWTPLRGTGFHEDVESILVKPGCVLFGYDEDDKNDRGTGISVNAVGSIDYVVKDLESKDFDLKDDIEAVECYCGAKAREATEVKPLKSANFLESIANWAGAGTATNHCNMWIHAFNRLPKSERACAIIFEADDCETSDGLLSNNWHLEVKAENKVVDLAEFSFTAKADSAEAVLVRPGCTFSGYQRDGGKGQEVTISASKTSNTPTYAALADGKYDLDEKMDSYKCVC